MQIGNSKTLQWELESRDNKHHASKCSSLALASCQLILYFPDKSYMTSLTWDIVLLHWTGTTVVVFSINYFQPLKVVAYNKLELARKMQQWRQDSCIPSRLLKPVGCSEESRTQTKSLNHVLVVSERQKNAHTHTHSNNNSGLNA